MADITKCSGIGCDLKDSCYRFTANASEFRQAYFMNIPIKKNQTCDYYWKDEK